MHLTLSFFEICSIVKLTFLFYHPNLPSMSLLVSHVVLSHVSWNISRSHFNYTNNQPLRRCTQTRTPLFLFYKPCTIYFIFYLLSIYHLFIFFDSSYCLNMYLLFYYYVLYIFYLKYCMVFIK